MRCKCHKHIIGFLIQPQIFLPFKMISSSIYEMMIKIVAHCQLYTYENEEATSI